MCYSFFYIYQLQSHRTVTNHFSLREKTEHRSKNGFKVVSVRLIFATMHTEVLTALARLLNQIAISFFKICQIKYY